MQKLKTSDYIEILKYYNQPIPKINKKGRKTIKRKAEKILAEKLCRCIKSVTKYNTEYESRAIGICRNSVIKQKKLKINRFTCKKKNKLLPDSKTKRNLSKTVKHLKLGKK